MTLATYTTTIGDGHHTRFTVTHRLHTATPLVNVYDKDRQLIHAAVWVSSLEAVIVDVGEYVGLSRHYHLGPLRLPRFCAKPRVTPASVPPPHGLRVQVVA